MIRPRKSTSSRCTSRYPIKEVVRGEGGDVNPEYGGRSRLFGLLRGLPRCWLPRHLGRPLKAVEDEQPQQSDQVDVVLQKPACLHPLPLFEDALPLLKLRQDVHEDVRDRDAARSGEPAATRDPLQKTQAPCKHVHQGQADRQGGCNNDTVRRHHSRRTSKGGAANDTPRGATSQTSGQANTVSYHSSPSAA